MSTENLKTNLNYDAISQAVGIINDKSIDNHDLKVLLFDLLSDIKLLSENVPEIVHNLNKEDTSFNPNDTTETLNYSESGLRLSNVQHVQEIISQKYSEAIKGNINESSYKNILREIVSDNNIRIPGTKSIDETVNELYKELRGYSVLDDFINQPADIEFNEFIEEIRIDDFNDIRIVRNGVEERTDVEFESPEHLEMFANTLVGNSGQLFSISNPAVKMRVGATTRVTLIRDPIATRDKRLTTNPSVIHGVIRKQRTKPFTVDQLVNLGSINNFGAELLKCIVGSGICTTFIGGTGTGKTSMMVPFLKEIDQRTISMAEVDEMNFRSLDFREYIEDKNGNQIRNKNYLKARNSAIMWECSDPNKEIFNKLKSFTGMFNIALTMTPSVIIIQESKGAEAADLQNAAISGHQTVTSIHCESAKLFATRIMKMIQMTGIKVSEDILMKEIVESFPLIVTCMRLKDGTRKIAEIVELKDYIPETKEVKTNTLISYEVEFNYIDEKTNKLKSVGKHKVYNLPSRKMVQKMLQNGLLRSSWEKITTEFKSVKSSDKPEDLDKTIYEMTRGVA